jgi:hypothetical protein
MSAQREGTHDLRDNRCIVQRTHDAARRRALARAGTRGAIADASPAMPE